MVGCQNYGPFLGPFYNTAPRIQGTQKGAIILTTTRMLGTCRWACQLGARLLSNSSQSVQTSSLRCDIALFLDKPVVFAIDEWF